MSFGYSMVVGRTTMCISDFDTKILIQIPLTLLSNFIGCSSGTPKNRLYLQQSGRLDLLHQIQDLLVKFEIRQVFKHRISACKFHTNCSILQI